MTLQIATLIEQRKSFALATVIDVVGSASAKVGSKALISNEAKNLIGWVGGGCAEQEVLRCAKIALKNKKAQTIEVNLDDEVFGIGIRCGGRMKIFIEPIFPQIQFYSSSMILFQNVLSLLDFESSNKPSQDPWALPLLTTTESPKFNKQNKLNETEKFIYDLAYSMAQYYKTNFACLKKDNQPNSFPAGVHLGRSVLLVGNNRITQTLAQLMEISQWHVDVTSNSLSMQDFSQKINFIEAKSFASSLDQKVFDYPYIILASQSTLDDQILESLLKSKVTHRYIGLVASQTRIATIKIKYKNLWSADFEKSFYSPCGLDISATHPKEIALSIFAEILHLRMGQVDAN